MANTVWSNVTKQHTSYNPASLRHTFGHEYLKTTRIRLGDHVRIGGGYYLPTSTAWSNVTL